MSSALLAPKSPDRGDAYVPVVAAAATTGAVSDARIDPEEWTLRLRLACEVAIDGEDRSGVPDMRVDANPASAGNGGEG